jgi:hypothetical protein
LAAVQLLEDRTLLSSFTVDNLGDVSDGDFTAGNFTLREAIEQANANPGADTIDFSPALIGGTITLGGTELTISDDVDIQGPGAGKLVLTAANASRVINITGGTVSISGMRITQGVADFGGGIRNAGDLTLREVELDYNHATQDGGGLFNDNATATIIASTLAFNTADSDGGALRHNGVIGSDPSLLIINSTISGNSALDVGGGLYLLDRSALIVNTTITGNRADADDSGFGSGGGLHSSNTATTTLQNSIVAGNFIGSGTTADDLGFPSSVPSAAPVSPDSCFNLIGDAGSSAGLTHGVNGNIVGNAGVGTIDITTVLDTVLAHNGGQTTTHALVADSLAINRGSNAKADDENGSPLLTDQRGPGFTRILGGRVDLGAVEATVYDDIIGRASNGTLVKSKSTGTNFQSSVAGNVPTSVDWDNFITGDFNNDGLKDLAGRSPSDGQWRVLLNTGSGFAAPAIWGALGTGTTWSDFVAGDFNGDGLTDVAARAASGVWVVGISDGTQFINAEWGAWSKNVTWHDVQVGDVDGDGRDDIAGRSSTGRWFVAFSMGDHFENVNVANWSTNVTWHDVLIGDFNGDGRADITAHSSTGKFVVGLANGAPWVEHTKWVTTIWGMPMVAGYEFGRIGDFNGDGKDDIVGFCPTSGDLIVGISNGSSSFKFQSWIQLSTNVTWQQIVVGDFNGDGLTDVATRASTGTWVVNASNGSKFVASVWGAWSKNVTWDNVFACEYCR